MHKLSMLGLLLAATITAAQDPSSTAPDEPVALDLHNMNPPIATLIGNATMPLEALPQHREGSCLVSLVVDINGEPKNPKLIRCTDSIFADRTLASIRLYKFKPATMKNGKAVAVRIMIEVNFRLPGRGNEDPPTRVRIAFNSPPGVVSSESDVKGIYPITKSFLAPNALPKLKVFANKGFGRAAFTLPLGVGCDVVLTIDAKGRASNPSLIHCDNDVLAKPVIASLLNSKYEPAKLDGNSVAIRSSVHIEFAGIGTESN